MHKHDLSQRLFLLAVLTAFSFSCKSSPTGPHVGQNLQLSTDYVTCTEVWLKVAYSGQSSPVSGGEFKITRDGDTVLTGNLTGSDTTVIDTTAQPEQAYTYRAYRYFRNQVSDTSLAIQVSTLDTTSHDFSWQVFQFGGAASSYLYDVSIVNDSDVWAVGAIYVDSADGQADPYPYNVEHWDGRSWQAMRIDFYTIWGQFYMTSLPAQAVFALDRNHVWIVSNNSELAEWNGVSQETPILLPVSPNRIWGSDSNSIYAAGVAGYGGGVAYYDGYTWQKIPTTATLAIQDIWGKVNPKTGKEVVMAVASDFSTPNQKEVLEVTPRSADTVNSAGLRWSIHSIWSPDGWLYYICGDGIFKDYSLDTPWRLTSYQSSQYTERIRGNAVNDFVIAGDLGLLVHYNGSSFREYNGHDLPNFLGNYYSVDMKGNMIVAVGSLNSGQAIAVIGRR